MKIKELFSKEPCNTGRQFELDFLRMILIIRLATVHVFVDASPPAALDVLGIPYYFDSVVGGFIGPTRFMLAMGIGLAYTRHGSAKEVFQRGIGGYGIFIVKKLMDKVEYKNDGTFNIFKMTKNL